MTEPSIVCEPLPNGYWRATICIPAYSGYELDYEQTESLFHDEDDARNWGEMTIRFMTGDAGVE